MTIYSVYASGSVTDPFTWFGNNNFDQYPGATDWVFIQYFNTENLGPWTLSGDDTFGYLEVDGIATFTGQITVIGQDGPQVTGADVGAVLVTLGGELAFSGSSASLVADKETFVAVGGTLNVSDGATAQFNANGSETAGLDVEDGDATISGDSTIASTNNGLIVGDDDGSLQPPGSTNATLTVSQGAMFTVGSSDGDTAYIANTTTSQGTLTVTDDGTVMASDAGMEVGVAATGTLYVQNDATLLLGEDGGFYIGFGSTGSGYFYLQSGGQVNGESFADIGYEENSYGDATIDDEGTSWSQMGDIVVGDSGFGILTVQNEASVTADTLSAGAESEGWGDIDIASGATVDVQDLQIGLDGHGDITVDGTGSAEDSPTTLTVENDASVGIDTAPEDDPIDSFTVQAGGQATIGNGLTIGDEEGSSGNVYVTDAGSTLAVSGAVDIGENGNGELDVVDGGTLTISGDNASLDIGVQADGQGLLSVQGSGATLNFDGELIVGDAGTGELDVGDGATWTTQDDVTVAAQEGSQGTIDVSGSNTSLTIVGDLMLGEAGTAFLTVDQGASLIVQGNLEEAVNQDAVGTSNFTDAGATVTINGNYVIGVNGTQTDTINNGVTNAVGGEITIGEYATGNGTVTVTGTDTELQAGSGDVTIGEQGTGTLIVSAGGSLSAPSNSVEVGSEAGATGTVTITGEDSDLTASSVTIGGSGDGTLTVEQGGSLTDAGDFSVGDEEDSTGEVALTDEGSSIDIGGDLTIGGSGRDFHR